MAVMVAFDRVARADIVMMLLLCDWVARVVLLRMDSR